MLGEFVDCQWVKSSTEVLSTIALKSPFAGLARSDLSTFRLSTYKNYLIFFFKIIISFKWWTFILSDGDIYNKEEKTTLVMLKPILEFWKLYLNFLEAILFVLDYILKKIIVFTQNFYTNHP